MKQEQQSGRRDFLAKTVLATAGMIGLPELIHAANPTTAQRELPAENAVVLFQGDSITDAGRSRDRYYPNEGRGMGMGYVHHIVTSLMGQYPDRKYRCYNRGISGNKVYQLANRWEDDCLNLEPAVLSILIGVNDFWHTLSGNYGGTAKTYEDDLRALLDRTLEALPNVRLMIGEPFAVAGGTAIGDNWYPEFNAYREAATQIAKDYKATFIPYQSVFDKALDSAPVNYWCPDGVHPSLAGAYLMAEAWLAAL